MPRTRLLLALPCALLLGGAVATTPAAAASFTVSSIADGGDTNIGDGTCNGGAGQCTLRAAVDEASGTPGPDTITLPSGSYQLTSGLGQLTIGSTVTINGAGARTTILRAPAGTRPLSVNATSTLRDLTVTGGNISSASAVVGGGIRITAGDLTLERVTVRDNQAASSQVVSGGGIGSDSTTATLTLIDSTVTGNTALGQFASDVAGDASGGGIYTAGPTFIRRSTVAANSTVGGVTRFSGGGGMAVQGNTIIDQSTIAGNAAATVAASSGNRQGGNLYVNANLTSIGNIIAGGTGSSGPDCWRASGTIVATTPSMLTTASNCFGATAVIANPKLASLTDNGGPTDTMRPAADSPAIDASSTCGERTTDQRGNTLFGGTGCDLGAVEVAASRTVTLQASKTSAASGEEFTLVAKLENAGFDVATGESLTVELPAGVTATTVTPSVGTCTSSGNVTCQLGSLARNTSASVVITARASGQSFGVTARRNGAVPDQNAADDAATVQLTGTGGTAGSGSTPAGSGSSAAGDTAAPALTALTLIKKPRPSLKKGATITLTLSEAATVQLTVERLLPGRRAGGTCKAKGTGKRCVRAVKVTTLARTLPAGAQRLTLTRKQLKAGVLRFSLVATDATGNRSAAVAVQGTVRR